MMRPTPLANRLARIAGAGMVLVGLLGTAFPAALAQSFGLPTRDPNGLGFVRATAIRDIALGSLTFAAAAGENADVLLVASGAGAGISLLDFLNAYYTDGKRLRSRLAAHVAGAASFAVILALLLRERE